MNVSIVPGLIIGDGSIIGLSALVVEDAPSVAIVGSKSQTILACRDNEHYKRLEQFRLYDGRGGEAVDD